MSEIGGDEEKTRDRKTISILSFAISICSLVFLAFFLLNIPMSISVYNGNGTLFEIGATGLPFSSILGIILTILSFVLKEPSTWLKWVGAILNVLFFLGVLLGYLFFAV